MYHSILTMLHRLPLSITKAFEELNIPTEALVQTSRERVSDRTRDLEYFVKETSSPESVTRFQAEAESLRALEGAVPGLVPRFYGVSSHDGNTVMISEFYDLSPLPYKLERSLAHRLAIMHDPANPASQSPNGMYGFGVPTYCGETEQDNHWENNWMVFFRDRRIKSLLDRIQNAEIKKLGKALCDLVVPFLLNDFEPSPIPVIIHGDLWSGNIAMSVKTGQPVIFDPSSYYGHNEVELGIMKMFGGRDVEFFEEYFHHRSKSQPHHEQRIRLYELYHHLNHTLIFGGGYQIGAIKIMKELIEYVGNVH